MTNYLLTGGGTAGHVNPLLALADYIQELEPTSRIIALGTREGLEAELVPARGYELRTIAKLPFPRKVGFRLFAFIPKFFRAVNQVRKLIRAEKIDVVVGFGGYASAPAYIAARLEKTNLVVHEANALPGIANKIGARFAHAVAVSFSNTSLPGAKVSGMPLRREIQKVATSRDIYSSRKHFGLDPETFTLLVTGGSLGAKSINTAIDESRSLLSAAGIQVLHIVGARSDLKPINQKGYLRIGYCDRMDLAISAADFVVSRAGASTVAEITAVGVPALYIPYAVGNGEQAHNVKDAVSAGAAVECSDAEFNREYISSNLVPLISNSRGLKAMGVAAKKLGKISGTKELYETVQGVLTR